MVAGSVIAVGFEVGLIGKFMVGSPARMARIKGVMRVISDRSKGWQRPSASTNRLGQVGIFGAKERPSDGVAVHGR